MKRFLVCALAAVVALGAASAVYANVCAFDPVPAATLLFPFVQLDFNSPVSGDNTLFAITNVSSSAVIAHVTVWSDNSSPVVDFNVLLSGYDVQTMSVRDIFVNGDLPNTGSSYTHSDYPDNKWPPRWMSQPQEPYYDIYTPNPTVSVNPIDGATSSPFEDGPVSEHNPYAAANPPNLLPSEGTDVYNVDGICAPGDQAYPDYPLIPASTLAIFQGALTSVQAAGDDGLLAHFNCSSSIYYISPDDWWQLRSTSQPTWMYITVDVVGTCNTLFPNQLGYWDPAIVRYDNVLIGDVFWVNTEARFSEADTAVSIEADPLLGVVASNDAGGHPYSYYYRYDAGFTPPTFVDYREPLPNAWAFRYMGAGTSGIDTYIRAWKNYNDYIDGGVLDSSLDGYLFALDCIPYTYYAWDENENFISVQETPWSGGETGGLIPNLLPLETQEVSVDQFDYVDANGWMLFIFPPSNMPAGPYQTWMGVKYGAYGQFSAAMSGSVMANWSCFSDQVLPGLGVNYPYLDINGYRVSPSAE